MVDISWRVCSSGDVKVYEMLRRSLEGKEPLKSCTTGNVR